MKALSPFSRVYSGWLLPWAAAAAIAILTLASPAAPVAGAASHHERGGVAVVGPNATPRPFGERLKLLNVGWYYDYSYRLDDEVYGTSKVAVLRGGEKNRAPLDQVAAQARSRPGHYWIVFNEPDLEGQDLVSDQFLAARGQQRFDYYAQIFHEYVTTLKTADPTAKVVAPNLFSWGGNFRGWIDAFRSAYRTHYGGEPPIDVWALHLYSFDPGWRKLPVIDLAYSKLLYRDFRDYIRSLPGHQTTPVWATEVGTIWGYRDIYQGPDGLFRGNHYAWPEIRGYLAELIPWLESEGADRWFLFGTNPAPDPWAGVANALYLLDDAGRPTEAGKVLARGTSIAMATR